LLSLILQSESTKEYLRLCDEIMGNYEFELPSYQKIFENLKSYFKNNQNFSSKLFSKFLPKEVTSLFDTCYILPLPKFEKAEKYMQELEKVACELRVLYLRNEIKIIAQTINKKEKEKGETRDLQKELSALLKLLQNLNQASKNGPSVLK